MARLQNRAAPADPVQTQNPDNLQNTSPIRRGGKNFAQNVLHLLSGVCHTHATVINKNKGTQRAHFKNKDIHEEWYEFVLAVARCPYENVGITLQALTVEWLNEMGESDAARWFEQHRTGMRNGRWLLAHSSHGNATNKNCLESWWRWMKEYTCQKKRVAICMFLANLFKHLRAESVEHQAKLALAGLHGKFESHPRLTKKGWKYVQTLDYSTFRLCKGGAGQQCKVP